MLTRKLNRERAPRLDEVPVIEQIATIGLMTAMMEAVLTFKDYRASNAERRAWSECLWRIAVWSKKRYGQEVISNAIHLAQYATEAEREDTDIAISEGIYQEANRALVNIFSITSECLRKGACHSREKV